MELETSWTDDIPRCKKTGVGTSTNETLSHQHFHPLEDRAFHFRLSGMSFFGVLDGFSGSGMSDFASKKMPAEVCLGQIDGNTTDEDIKEVLKAAFVSTDRDYFESLNESLARALTHNKNSSRESFSPLCGCSATIGILLDDGRLFIANAGDTRAVLVSKGKCEEELSLTRLSIDHVLGANEDEELRLQHLGLDTSRLKKVLGGPRGYTRCLGYHRAKSGTFKEGELLLLNSAKGLPVLCEPEIQGSIPVDKGALFLLIYSRPLTETMAELWGEEEGDLDGELCRLVREEFESNGSVTGVAQSVVDKILRLHKEKFEEHVNKFREDVTLLVHNLGCVLTTQPSRSRSKSSTREEGTFKGGVSTTTTESSEALSKQGIETLPVDANGRIMPYVDFSYFNEEWRKHQEKEANEQAGTSIK